MIAFRRKKTRVLTLLVVLPLTVLGGGGPTIAQSAGTASHGISPETVANYLYAIIAATRTTYTTKVVERMQNQGVVLAAEDWESRKALPLPAQFLMETAHLVAKENNGVRIRLISLSPIYQRNAPATEFERKGLEAVRANPEQSFTGTTISGRKQFFQAIYADTAVSTACVVCHNTHPKSPMRNFQLGDVMGGVVLTIPLTP